MSEASTNCYRIQGPALISFSGGRTSGKLLKQILDAHGGTLPDDVRVAFANTGKEAHETLDFVQECSDRWSVHINWLEFDPDAPHKTRIVNHNSASRNGEPLQRAIDTRPTAHLFNPVSRYCTGTTKQRRLEAYGREYCGWPVWKSVRGIRADEKARVESLRARYAGGPRDRQILCLPLVDAGVTKADVRAFWQAQPFDLRLPYDEVSGETVGGNCNGCIAMAEWKILAALRRRPEAADWWIEQQDRMRARIAGIPPRDPSKPDLRASFFKDGTDFRDLKRRAMSNEPIVRSARHGGGSVDCACTD